jgi:hypothetical protein
MGDGTRQAYCPQCEVQREIKRTVAWQPDLCTACGGDIEEND